MFPTPEPGRPFIIAHRGARSLAPENTLAAARKALETGADGWELDVRMTADGVPVVVHDPTLERTSNAAEVAAGASAATGSPVGAPPAAGTMGGPAMVFTGRRPWPVHELALAEIRRLDFGSWFAATDPFGEIAAGAVSAEELASYSGEPGPTLAEALVFSREAGLGVNVELKDLTGTAGDARIVETVAGLLRELEMSDRVLVSSFNLDLLLRLRRLAPEVPTAVLVEERPPDPVGLLRRVGARYYHPGGSAVDPEAIWAVSRQGFVVIVWTVNDADRARELVKAGAAGIVTDYPQKLVPALRGRTR